MHIVYHIFFLLHNCHQDQVTLFAGRTSLYAMSVIASGRGHDPVLCRLTR